jgi:DNA-binding MurR/RpiR family transcriptional regulator
MLATPQSQKEVLAALLDCFGDLPTQLQITARYIIDHPHEVGVQTMRTLASNADVHPNSFVRLARHIGFDGYDELRERFRDFVRAGTGSSPDRAKWLQTIAIHGGQSEVVSQMASSVLTNVEQMFENQDVKQLTKSIRWMIDADRVYILGVGSAYTLAYNFWYVARMMFDHFILVPRHGSLPLDDLTRIGKNDLLFGMTFQPYRTDVIEALRFARRKGTKTISLTDSKATSVYREADLGLYAPTHTPHFFHSNSALAALLETLCALLAAEGGNDVVDQIKQFNELRWESGIYET